MKPKMLSLTVLALGLGIIVTHSQTSRGEPDPFAKGLQSPQPQDDRPRMIRVMAEFIEMPQATFTGLMAAPGSSANDSDLREQCSKLIEKKEARMIETLAVTALPGQIATSEDIMAFIYPTEPEPSSFRRPANSEIVQSIFIPNAPSVPQAYDTRNVGSTLQVEAKIDNSGRFVEIGIFPKIVYHVGNDVWGIWKNDEVEVENSMPRFFRFEISTGLTLVTGQTHMAAALSPKDDQGVMDSSRKVILFIRADIITAGK